VRIVGHKSVKAPTIYYVIGRSVLGNLKTGSLFVSLVSFSTGIYIKLVVCFYFRNKTCVHVFYRRIKYRYEFGYV